MSKPNVEDANLGGVQSPGKSIVPWDLIEALEEHRAKLKTKLRDMRWFYDVESKGPLEVTVSYTSRTRVISDDCYLVRTTPA